VLGPGNALPSGRLASITVPVLVLSGANSPAWMASAAHAVAGVVPGAIHRMLDGQSHSPAPESLAPELADFFLAG
jgi:pimeloyl-ACP methyl ester carboxylesterase